MLHASSPYLTMKSLSCQEKNTPLFIVCHNVTVEKKKKIILDSIMFICYPQPNLTIRTFTPKYNIAVHLFVCCLRQAHITAQTALETAMQS